jgi:AcrR family transcriptional regulator
MKAKAKVRLTPPPDHRTRVGQERRARTRKRILEAALGVFAEKGGAAPVIDDFIKAADVARGTFYNYYNSVEELLAATTVWLEEDLMLSIERELDGLTDPVDRLTLGVRLWLRKAEIDPVWCAFVAKAVTHGEVVEDTLRSDLRNGARAGVFVFDSVQAARDLVVGTLHEAMRRMSTSRVPATFTDEVARLVFRGLGVPSRRIQAALRRPIPPFRRAMQPLR